MGFLYSDRYHSGAQGSEPMNSACLRAPLHLYVSTCVPSMCRDVCKGFGDQLVIVLCRIDRYAVTVARAAGEMSRTVSVKARWTDPTLSSAKPCE